MRVLITGVKGIIGGKLYSSLSSKGDSVFGVDLMHSFNENGYVAKMSEEENIYSRCDISNYRQIARVIDKYGPFDVVYNCAAEFGRWNGEDYYEQLWMTNAIGTKNIIRLQEEHGFKLVHFSSSEVYGDYSDIMAESVLNDVPIAQLNDYAITKRANEMQIFNSISMYSTKTVIVRLFNTYGPGEHYHAYRSVNCKFCYSLLNGLPVTVYKGHYRSSTYIDDAVNALVAISRSFVPGKIYNIGSNEYHSIEELADLALEYSGANKSLVRYAESEILTTKIKKVDISLAVAELGMTQTVSLRDGVRKTIKWMREIYKI